ncbi:MAG: hypothetical protein M3430_10355 [Acidobacteriota bacterium]|nr:hypothetical protein [Acidobacteriota bacterium]
MLPCLGESLLVGGGRTAELTWAGTATTQATGNKDNAVTKAMLMRKLESEGGAD